VDNPTLEKSDKFKAPFLSEGDNNKCEGFVLKLSSDLPWYDFHNELASTLLEELLLYLIELPTSVE
jgi:hypothetical protein